GTSAEVLGRVVDAANQVGRTWCGSWIHDYALVYYAGFESPPAGARFDADDGFSRYGDTSGDWRRFQFEAVPRQGLGRAGVSEDDLKAIEQQAQTAKRVFERAKPSLLTTLAAAVEARRDSTLLQKLISETEALRPTITAAEYCHAARPSRVVMHLSQFN